MSNHTPKPKYIFVNPNSSAEFEIAIRKILIEKLLALPTASTLTDR